MDGAEIARALRELPGLQVSVSGEGIHVRVPSLNDNPHLAAAEVRQLRQIFGPRGEPAVQLAVGAPARPLIITADDVVFAPASADAVLDSSMRYEVSNAPVLVAYSEMERDTQSLARSCEGQASRNLDRAGGDLLLLRCFIAGAVRCGMRPVRAVAWWQRAWAALGGDVALPPFRQDPVWDELCAEAASLAIVADAPGSSGEPEPGDVTAADFEALAPRLAVARLDQEFIESWRRWVRISPATFAGSLLDGADDARAEVSLYPEGGGEVAVTVDADGECVAIMQLGFSFRDDDFTLDEIRIMGSAKGTGLFQRLTFNAGALAEQLGFRQVRALATGVGSYALARLGRYDAVTWPEEQGDGEG